MNVQESLVDKPQELLDLLTHVETLVAFVIFLVPGFLSVRAYEATRGSEG
jgi:hypothetical protein